MKSESLINKTVRIISDNDCYENYMNKDLVIVDATNNSRKNPFYDDCMNGMYLCELIDADSGEYIPFALYEYEFEIIR